MKEETSNNRSLKEKNNIDKMDVKVKVQRGITLVSLVITIVILIILATVSINVLLGEGGLINRAKTAKFETEKAAAREQIEVVLLEASMDKALNSGYDENGYLDKFVEDRLKGVWLDQDEISYDGFIFALDRSVPKLGNYTGQDEGPRIKEIKVTGKTTNSVSIEVDARNAERGKYTYSYKKDSEGEAAWKDVAKEVKENTCTFDNLEENEIYNLKVRIETAEGAIEQTINEMTGEVPRGTITFDEVEWVGDETAKVRINTSSQGYTMQYIILKQGESTEGLPQKNWSEIASGSEITGLYLGDTVYARLYDGKNESDYASVNILDETAPQVATIDLSNTNITTETNVTATVTHRDNESGVNIEQSKYIWNTSNAKLGTDASLYTGGTFSSNGQQISTSFSSPETYYLHVLTVDNASNGTETVSNGVEVKQLATNISVSPSNVTLVEGQTSQLTATVSPSNANTKTVTWSSNNTTVASVNSSTGLVTAKTEGSATITAIATDGSGVKGSCTVTVEPAIPIPENTSYVGYYADVDGNGSVDGVIYADLAIGGSGQWIDSDGKYTIPKGSNFKKYSISKKNHSDDFDTADVIKVTNASGNERFYVMALDDEDSSYHCWYYGAYDYGMSDYATTTSTAFGRGKQNTNNMIAKWNRSEYGLQNGNSSYPDMWGVSTVQSKINANPAWYVPSKEEWSAFGAELEITSNYGDKGLMRFYWSSSQVNTVNAWRVNFDNGGMGKYPVEREYSVRLGTTF